LSAPYIMISSAAVMALFELVNRFERAYKRIPALSGLAEFISRDLLTATVLHYLVVNNLLRIALFLQRGGGRALSRAIERHELLFILIGSALSLVLFIGLLRITLFAWERMREKELFARLRANYHLAALATILVLVPLSRVQVKIWLGTFQEAFHLEWRGPALTVMDVFIFHLISLATLYFALEMKELRSRRSWNGKENK
jgi:hypothetical protein